MDEMRTPPNPNAVLCSLIFFNLSLSFLRRVFVRISELVLDVVGSNPALWAE